MGQKVNPHGLRVGVIKNWDSRWIAADGKVGDLILEEAKRVLADEYPQYNGKLLPALPDEKSRRVGQSVAAASLPEL